VEKVESTWNDGEFRETFITLRIFAKLHFSDLLHFWREKEVRDPEFHSFFRQECSQKTCRIFSFRGTVELQKQSKLSPKTQSQSFSKKIKRYGAFSSDFLLHPRPELNWTLLPNERNSEKNVFTSPESQI
jgi:hypothetical protein